MRLKPLGNWVVCCLLVVSAPCVGCAPDPASSEPSTPPTVEAEPEAAAEPEPPAAVEEVEPLAEPPELATSETVRVPSDGFELVGELRRGESDRAALVVLVHQIGSTRGEWTPLLRHLGAAPALSTFAYDTRGHGESATQRGREVQWSGFDRDDWESAAADVNAVIAHLTGEVGLEPAQVLVVGSSIGSSEALVAAASSESIHSVVALSPGRAYRGLDAIVPVGSLQDRPLLLLAAEGESASVTAAQNMARIASSGRAILVPGSAHGVRMFDENPSALRSVLEFLREHATAPPEADEGAPETEADTAPPE